MRSRRYFGVSKRRINNIQALVPKTERGQNFVYRQATEMMFRLVEQMADKEGLTEQFKAENPMLWVGKMNEIQARAREIVNTEIIYT